MKADKYSIKRWGNAHKKELVLVGISATVMATLILGCKNKDELLILKNMISNKIHKISKCDVPIKNICQDDTILVTESNVLESILDTCNSTEISQEVRSHIRNLHAGWNASAKKVATAAEHGYVLQPGQTWVTSYPKYRTVA